MSPLKKLFSALRLSGFLAFVGAIALASNHASRLEFYCGVCSFFRRWLRLSFIKSKRQKLKFKINLVFAFLRCGKFNANGYKCGYATL